MAYPKHNLQYNTSDLSMRNQIQLVDPAIVTSYAVLEKIFIEIVSSEHIEKLCII